MVKAHRLATRLLAPCRQTVTGSQRHRDQRKGRRRSRRSRLRIPLSDRQEARTSRRQPASHTRARPGESVGSEYKASVDTASSVWRWRISRQGPDPYLRSGYRRQRKSLLVVLDHFVRSRAVVRGDCAPEKHHRQPQPGNTCHPPRSQPHDGHELQTTDDPLRRSTDPTVGRPRSPGRRSQPTVGSPHQRRGRRVGAPGRIGVPNHTWTVRTSTPAITQRVATESRSPWKVRPSTPAASTAC